MAVVVAVVAALLTLGLPTTNQAQEAPPPAPLSSEIPSDFHSDLVREARTLDGLQHDFDIYSWETFIALNWPVDGDGTPLPGEAIGAVGSSGRPNCADHITLWETWKSTTDLFPQSGNPVGWDQGPRVNPSVAAESIDGEPLTTVVRERRVKWLSKLAKGFNWFEPIQPFNTGPLIDSEGNYARFEVLVNKEVFDYIFNNRLFSRPGQAAFREDIVFPMGEFQRKKNENGEWELIRDPRTGRPVNGTPGSIVVKAAWKVLTEEERDKGRFYARRAAVYTPADDPSLNLKHTDLERPVQKARWVGLVGLHIAHKSEDVPQWNWSTFEHVDNCPDINDDMSKNYSFYSAGQPTPINTPAAAPWHADREDAETVARRTQVVRQIPISADVRALNQRFQERLRRINPDSPWQHYQLISTQWSTRPALANRDDADRGNVPKLRPADLLGGPAPVFLSNTTMETFLQGQVPNGSSSCLDCHGNATDRNGRFSDFSYLLERARTGP